MRAPHRARAFVGLVGVLVAAAACGDNAGTDEPDTVTYAEHVQPLLAEHCVGCHQADTFAPFELDDYEEVRARADMIVAATSARIMPPHPADNSGACNTFAQANWLTDDEIDLLERWRDAGTLEGAGTPRPVRDPAMLAGTFVERDIGADYTPQPDAGGDEYRCFLVDAPVMEDGDYFLTGYEVVPANAAIVHHMILYLPRSDDDVAVFQNLDAADPAPGYRCFGGPSGEGAMGFASIGGAWAPGGGAINFPGGTGLQLAGKRKLIVQMHYNTTFGSGSDRTKIRFATVKSGVIPGFFLPFGPSSFSIPTGQARALVEMTGAALSGPGGPGGGGGGNTPSSFKLLGMFPHMHARGTSVRLTRADASQACLIDVPRWDYHWQLTYFLDTPQMLGLTEQLSIQCSYDTRGAPGPITWGEGSLDEMCAVGLYAMPVF
jgi:Copper type II ascorbate-dependent monooxygenase, N-terminal domain/Copper type II ascorbate-dependent monooxygenase, C-terminal domain